MVCAALGGVDPYVVGCAGCQAGRRDVVGGNVAGDQAAAGVVDFRAGLPLDDVARCAGDLGPAYCRASGGVASGVGLLDGGDARYLAQFVVVGDGQARVCAGTLANPLGVRRVRCQGRRHGGVGQVVVVVLGGQRGGVGGGADVDGDCRAAQVVGAAVGVDVDLVVGCHVAGVLDDFDAGGVRRRLGEELDADVLGRVPVAGGESQVLGG